MCAFILDLPVGSQQDVQILDRFARFGYSGKPEYTDGCLNVPLGRTIRCKFGYRPKQSAIFSLVFLGGSAPFEGCLGVLEM